MFRVTDVSISFPNLSYCLLFCTKIDCEVGAFPLVQDGYFFQTTASDLLEITSYITPNTRKYTQIWGITYF